MYYVIKFQSPYERIKEHAPFPEVALFRSVIYQASTDKSSTSPRPKDKSLQKEAEDWAQNGGDDFEMVCNLAAITTSCARKFMHDVVSWQKR